MRVCDIFTLNTSFTARVLFLIPAREEWNIIIIPLTPSIAWVLFLIPATCGDAERGGRTFYTTAPTTARVSFLIPA